jgi:hypothetical protein
MEDVRERGTGIQDGSNVREESGTAKKVSTTVDSLQNSVLNTKTPRRQSEVDIWRAKSIVGCER